MHRANESGGWSSQEQRGFGSRIPDRIGLLLRPSDVVILRTWTDMLLRNVRFGARSLWQSPGFTWIAIAMIGLGVGANTAVFSVMSAVLLRLLPVHDPHRLVFLSTTRVPPGVTSH